MFLCFQDRVSELPVGPQPPFFEKNLFNLLPAASTDRKPADSSFGDVLQQVYPLYRQVERPSGFTTRPTLFQSIHDLKCFTVFLRVMLFLSRSWQETPDTPETS